MFIHDSTLPDLDMNWEVLSIFCGYENLENWNALTYISHRGNGKGELGTHFGLSSVQFSSVQSLSHVWLFETPWIAARQASLSIINSQNLLKPMSIELVMASSHLILCRTRVGCHFLLQGIFLTQGWKSCLLHCRQIHYCWAIRGKYS